MVARCEQHWKQLFVRKPSVSATSLVSIHSSAIKLAKSENLTSGYVRFQIKGNNNR